jgi:hypothetical protein
VTTSERSKEALRRWYDDMWAKKDFALVPELAGPLYTRHETSGTRVVTAEEYRDSLLALADAEIEDLRYHLVAEGDRVVAIGSWRFNGQQWDWVQAFRVEDDKLVETWLSGIGVTSNWAADAIH